MDDRIRYVINNGFFLVFVIGTFLGNSPALILTTLIIWLVTAGAFWMHTGAGQQKFRNFTPPVPVWVDILFDTIVGFLLLYSHQNFLAFLYIVHLILLHLALVRVKHQNSKN